MKPDQLFQELKDLADKMNITVSEQNFRISGMRVKSGMCKIKGKDMIILDKNKSVYKKNKILATCLSQMPHEDLYIVPVVREWLQKFSKK
jgi:hypothetical protein